ncbi:MAG TPA: Rdx family protein [Candidatus Limnocylindrales bacterium]|nr:Rdx family protein [Candidatus Limnocylindrales bacterium]
MGRGVGDGLRTDVFERGGLHANDAPSAPGRFTRANVSCIRSWRTTLGPASDKHALEIEFCVPCDFRPQALGLAREVIDQWADRLAEIRLVPSSGGRFEVTLDGELIFSKARLERHAEPGELSRLIGERIGQPTPALFG